MIFSIKNLEDAVVIDIKAKKPVLSEYLLLGKTIKKLARFKNRHIVLNLNHDIILENSFIEILLSSWKTCDKSDCILSICGVKADMFCIFYLLRLDKYFEFYEDKYDAVLRENRFVRRRLKVV